MFKKVSLITLLASALVGLTVADAQTVVRPAPVPPLRCPEGTFNGKCVNPYVALMGRRAAIAYTQAQISITERPYPASADTTYSYPNNVAGAPSFVARETLFGEFGTRGTFERARRGH